MKVRVKSWNTVAVWKWLANDDKCGICRAPFDGCCSDCKVPGDDCPLVWGVCSHCYHMHCIMKWLAAQATQTCPMCRGDWALKSEISGMNSSLSSLLHLQGLPPLPRSLSGYGNNSHHQPAPVAHGSPQNYPPSGHSTHFLVKSSVGHRPSPVPPPRPHSRRSSSSGSSFRASPEHVPSRGIVGATEAMRSSPRSLSSSPHSPHIDSGLGRSSADSFSERAFVRVVKSPPGGSKMDAQLSQLRRDMLHLRQQDMSLLGHLLQINQGIQDLKSVLVPPPQPAPSMPMFHSTPVGYSPVGYGNPPPPRHLRKVHHPSPVSRGAKLFARRSSSEKMMNESELALGALGAVGGLREKDEESDSLSSLEFGDV